MEITYRKEGDVLLPNLYIPEDWQVNLNKYGRMRLNYLKKEQRLIFGDWLVTGALSYHLREIQETARNRVEKAIQQMVQANGVDEEMKRKDQMKWVGMMNSFQQAAEEEVIRELICVPVTPEETQHLKALMDN